LNARFGEQRGGPRLADDVPREKQMKKSLTAVAFCVTLATLAGCAGLTTDVGQTSQRTIADANISAAVEQRLNTDRARGSLTGVTVTTENGIVTLSGRVPDLETKQRASELAREVEGVRRVVNNLRATTDTVTGTQDRSTDQARIRRDQTITTAVKRELAEDRSRAFTRIDVDTTDGVVTLSGTVAGAADRRRASQVANTVKGVRQVVNHLQLRSANAGDAPANVRR
jgi:hyperosmotically inducible protein